MMSVWRAKKCSASCAVISLTVVKQSATLAVSFFEEMFVLHPEFVCHFFRIVVLHCIVERQSVASNSAPYYGSVGSKYRAYFRHSVFYI